MHKATIVPEPSGGADKHNMPAPGPVVEKTTGPLELEKAPNAASNKPNILVRSWRAYEDRLSGFGAWID